MNVQYTVPVRYWIATTRYRCGSCGADAVLRWAPGGEVVRFVNGRGEERWLPTYGAGGYLDLLEQLVPGYSKAQEISARVAKDFKVTFSRFLSKANPTDDYAIADAGPVCSRCGSRDLEITSEVVDQSPPVPWLDYAAP